MIKRATQVSVTLFAFNTSGSPVTGLSPTAQVSKDGGAFGPATNGVASIGLGYYSLVLTVAEMTADVVVVQAASAGATFDGLELHTEADYTSARAADLDATISSRAATADTRFANLDATISSRAATADTRFVNLDATVSSRLSSVDFLAATLGVNDVNINQDSFVWSAGKLVSCRIRSYDTAAHALAGGSTGLLATWAVTAAYDGDGNCTGYQKVEA